MPPRSTPFDRALRLRGQPLPVVGRARVYACGITPYDTTHLGHAATFVWVDTAVRVLRSLGVDVEVCRNVTDVDDDILAAARRAEHPVRPAGRGAAVPLRPGHGGARGARRRTTSRGSTGTSMPSSASRRTLLARGHAYESGGSVYFRRRRRAGPRRARPRTQAEALLAAARPRCATTRTAPTHFDAVLWQRAGDGEPAWPSPWGPGRPGWHAGCTAMAMTVLGGSVDLHAGGADLRFPHHAYEAAQAEAVSGVTPFARAWLHVGTVGIGGAKMAKSAGNLVLVGDVLRSTGRPRCDCCCSTGGGTSRWDYSPTSCSSGRGARGRALRRGRAARTAAAGAEGEVQRALLDDLDVPRALAAALGRGGAARSAVRLLGLPS